jgi:hypothetical protein
LIELHAAIIPAGKVDHVIGGGLMANATSDELCSNCSSEEGVAHSSVGVSTLAAIGAFKRQALLTIAAYALQIGRNELARTMGDMISPEELELTNAAVGALSLVPLSLVGIDLVGFLIL